MSQPFTDDELERVRDNPQPRCSGCGCLPRLEHDGITHWLHDTDCPVLQRIHAHTEPRGPETS